MTQEKAGERKRNMQVQNVKEKENVKRKGKKLQTSIVLET